MKITKGFINLSQVVVNSLVEGVNLGTYYCFRDPREAKQLIRILDIFCDIELRYVEVSFYNESSKDQTIALRVFQKPLGSDKDLIHYLDNDVKNFIDSLKVTNTPPELRVFVRDNFF